MNIFINFLAFTPLLATPFSDQLVRIAIFVVILALVWIILRTVLRLAMRVFSFGCTAIVILGLVLLAIRYFRF